MQRQHNPQLRSVQNLPGRPTASRGSRRDGASPLIKVTDQMNLEDGTPLDTFDVMIFNSNIKHSQMEGNQSNGDVPRDFGAEDRSMQGQNFIKSPILANQAKSTSPLIPFGTKINDGIDQYMFRQQQNLSPPQGGYNNSQNYGAEANQDNNNNSGRQSPLLSRKIREKNKKNNIIIQIKNQKTPSRYEQNVAQWIKQQLSPSNKDNGNYMQQAQGSRKDSKGRVMSPNGELKLLQMVYGFKYHKRDPFMQVPSVSGFYAFLASILMNQETKQDIMLNIPETLIINNHDIIRSHCTNYSPQSDTQFIYLCNPQVVPSQGNQPSLPLVQKLHFQEHQRIEDASNILSNWLLELNLKKLKQHEEDRGEDYDTYIPLSVSKKPGSNRDNLQSLDFFEESAYNRLKIAQVRGQDIIMQRYIPAKSNNNSIVRVVWQRAPDEKHMSNTNAGGYFKMFSVATLKQYNGVITSEKFSPEKKKHDINRFLNTGVSPKADKLKSDIDTPDKMLNAQYMQDLRAKFDQGIDMEAEFMTRACQKQIKDDLKGLDNETQKLLIIQDEIDQVKEFQYQFCTSDMHPEKNFASEISPSSDLSFKSEIFFQGEQLIRILNAYIKKQKFNRKLSVACFDFIQDYTDRRWKFLNLKYFYTQDNEGTEIDKDYFLMKSTLTKGFGNPSPFRELSPEHIQKEDEPKFMKKTVCDGDYCTIQIDKNYSSNDGAKFSFASSQRQNSFGRQLSNERKTVLPFGYLRDALKLISFQQNILTQDFNLFPSNMGIDAVHSLSTQKKYKGMHGEHQEFFSTMKKVIQLDRARRRGIMEGKLRDSESFVKLSDEFYTMKKSATSSSGSHNDQSIAQNGIKSAYLKMQRLTSMISDMMRTNDQELNSFFQAEYQLMLQNGGNKLFDTVPVCVNCMRIYQFLSELYTKMEEYIASEANKGASQEEQRLKNLIFMGLDPKLNEKVIAILKRHLNRINKMNTGSNASGINSIRTSPRLSSGNNMTETRFSSIDVLNGIHLMTGIDPKNIQPDIPKPPGSSSRTNLKDLNINRPMSAAKNRISEYVGSITAGASTEQSKHHRRISSNGVVDISLINDRDMIPDIITLPKQKNIGQRNNTLKQATSHSTNLYLPPVSVNEYIVQQRKLQSSKLKNFSNRGSSSVFNEEASKAMTPQLQLPPLVPLAPSHHRMPPAVDGIPYSSKESPVEKERKRKKIKKKIDKEKLQAQIKAERCEWLGQKQHKENSLKRNMQMISGYLSPLNQQQIQALPLRSRSCQNYQQAKNTNETSPSIQDLTPIMIDGPKINVVTKFHIKNYQPQVYEEIQKIMLDRKKKIVRKAKKKAAGLKKQSNLHYRKSADPDIDQLVNKYVQQNASKNCTEDEDNAEGIDSDQALEECLDEVDFSAPIEAIVVNGDITKSKLLQVEDQGSLGNSRTFNNSKRPLSQEAGDQETLQIGQANNITENNQVLASLEFFDFSSSLIKMPPVHQSSLVPDDVVSARVKKVVLSNQQEIMIPKPIINQKLTPAFTRKASQNQTGQSEITQNKNLSVVQQSSDEEGSQVNIDPHNRRPSQENQSTYQKQQLKSLEYSLASPVDNNIGAPFNEVEKAVEMDQSAGFKDEYEGLQ